MKIKRQTRRGRLHRYLFFAALLLIAGGAFALLKPTHAELAEINPDDWTLELLFFDSTVNKGRDPIVNEEWIIPSSDGNESFGRTITMQVNYRNENIDRDYQPGELEIRVPNPFTKNNRNAAQLSAQIAIGANAGSQTEYEWNYNSSTYNTTEFIFTNSRVIEAYSNIEGSIQMVYAFTSISETAEKYDDSCLHELEQTGIKAVMNGVAESNETSFKYSRLYNHPWTKSGYTINTLLSKIASYDNLGSDAADYTWVKYRFYGKSSSFTSMSYSREDVVGNDNSILLIGLSNFRVRDSFPNDVKMVDRNGNTYNLDNEGYLQISELIEASQYSVCNAGYYDTCYELYVGYPKDKYNDELGTSQITNTVELRGTYSSENQESALADKTISFNINDYAFDYTGGNNGVEKAFFGNADTNIGKKPFYYQNIVRDGSAGKFYNYVNASYDGTAYTAHVGDDVLYYIDEESNYNMLEDSKYYFSSVTVPQLTNSNGTSVSIDKYSYSVFVRYRGSTEYVKFGDYTETSKTISFGTDQYVQGWYVEIYNLQEGINKSNFSTIVILKDANSPREGTLYNFSYFDKIVNGTPLQLSNLDHYATGITKDVMAAYDIEHYGRYLLRSVAQATWEYHDIGSINHSAGSAFSTDKSPVYDPSDEYFKGSLRFTGTGFDSNGNAFADMALNAEQIHDEDWHRGGEMNILLPLGMMPNATEEEIANSAFACSTNYMYGTDGQKLFANDKECVQFMKEHMTVTFTKNWNNTGRWHIKAKLDFSSKPYTIINGAATGGSWSTLMSLYLPYKIPYDSYAEYGRTYELTSYYSPDVPLTSISNTDILDDGRFDAVEADIDEDGSTSDYVDYKKVTVNLVAATSTSQDLQISVLTDHNGTYDIEDSRSGIGEDYVYKLRMRTGTNRVTNVVLYNHIEEAYEDNNYWQGHFDGVDTSYAESKLDNNDNPIHVKVYWSPKSDAGTLVNDDSWQEYDESTVDKTQVRSLAFQYLDPDGNPSVMPQSYYSYVLVKMKATENEDVNSFTYNSLSSEWNAIDNFSGETIYNITGLTSNIVRVYLNEDLTLKIKKIWDDYDNYYKERPDTITFVLYHDGEEVDRKVMNVAEGETEVTFENLDALEQELYTVEEVEVEGYTSSAEQNNATLAYEFTNKIDKPAPSTNPQTADTNPWLYITGGGVVVVIVSVGAVKFARRRA